MKKLKKHITHHANRNHLAIAILFALLCGIFLCACQSNDHTPLLEEPLAEASNESNTADATPNITLTIQGMPVSLNMNANGQVYETSMMTTEFPMDFALSEYEGWSITINDVPVQSGKTTQIQVPALDKDTAVIIRYENTLTGETGEQYIRTLPNAVRDYNVLSKVTDGVYYFAQDGYAMKMNHEGKIIFYYADNTETVKYLNEFKRVEINDTVYYLLTAYESSYIYPFMTIGAGPNAKEIILDENYYPVTTITSLFQTEKTSAEIPLDQHEFLMLGENHYVLCGYVPQRVTNIPDTVPHSEFGARVAAAVIQEVKDGEVIFEWYSTDYPELYEYSVDCNDFFNDNTAWSDYMHLNSIDVDETDGNFVCSFRHLDGCLKIDRTTGEILWILGGTGDQFGLTAEQKTSRQHDIRWIGEHTYSVFDNGFETGQTRVVEYTLDETSKTLIAFKEYYIEKLYSPYQGNAQKIGDSSARYVCGGGSWTDNTNASFYDVDFETCEVLFEAINSYNSTGYDQVYRAYRFDR